MASRANSYGPVSAADRLHKAAKQLASIAEEIKADEGNREDLDAVIAEIRGTQHDVFGRRPRAPSGQGAKAKILEYLKARIGQSVYGEELAAVSGIQEWARRVRELRVEDGYLITEVGRSTYRLERSEPDEEQAQQWRLANQIRNQPGGARDRIGQFLEVNVGKVVTRQQIAYVGRIAESARRVRELRDEHGWPIDSHIDDPTLGPGGYRLVSADPADRRDPIQRLYPENIRQRVFERDDYTCQVCGRNREKAEAVGDTRFYLEIHHRVAIADELAALPNDERNDIGNLMTLCHADHLRETAKLQRKKRRKK